MTHHDLTTQTADHAAAQRAEVAESRAEVAHLFDDDRPSKSDLADERDH